MKYAITYDYDGESGSMEIELTETAMQEIVATLQEKGCRNIVVKPCNEYDPCNYCNRPLCYGCPNLEEE